MRNAFLLVALVAASAAGAQSLRVDRVEIVDKGTYEIVAGAQTQNANTPTGTITAVASEKLVQAGPNVAGKVGVEFGLRYRVIGEPAGAEVPLDIVYTYPAPGLKDPAAAAPSTESRFSRTKKIGETVYLGYGLENDWEVVPGTWTFTISSQGRKLAEESFTLTK